jgi:hypothetical protein
MADLPLSPPSKPVLPASLVGLLSQERTEGLQVEPVPSRRYLVTQVTHFEISAENRDAAIRHAKALRRSGELAIHGRGGAVYSALRLDQPPGSDGTDATA